MKLDILADPIDQTPIVRLYEYTGDELEELAAAVSVLADGTATTINLSNRPWLQSLDDFFFC